MSGRFSSTRASATRWRWGRDRRPPKSPTWCSSPTSSTSPRRPSRLQDLLHDGVHLLHGQAARGDHLAEEQVVEQRPVGEVRSRSYGTNDAARAAGSVSANRRRAASTLAMNASSIRPRRCRAGISRSASRISRSRSAGGQLGRGTPPEPRHDLRVLRQLARREQAEAREQLVVGRDVLEDLDHVPAPRRRRARRAGPSSSTSASTCAEVRVLGELLERQRRVRAVAEKDVLADRRVGREARPGRRTRRPSPAARRRTARPAGGGWPAPARPPPGAAPGRPGSAGRRRRGRPPAPPDARPRARPRRARPVRHLERREVEPVLARPGPARSRSPGPARRCRSP